MESCVALWLKVLCAAVLIPVLRANGQVISTEDPPTTQNSTTPTQTLGRSYQVANASTVTIEAMCSPNSAGLKWTARSGYTISVDFSCTSDNVELTVDRCFKMDGTVFIIPQLVEPFKTHIIGTELEPGTVCTFHATTRDISDRTMDTVSASCTVENSNPPLPTNCNVLSDTQQCQCSCNPGFIESTGSNAFFECESTDLPTTQGNMATTVQLSMTPTQSVGQVADSSTVTIEAMCSSNSAGLKWTVPDETGTGAYTISVGFRCASDLDEVNDDRCFKKDGTVFIIPQLVEPFKTHIIGTELEPGTVCTFTAITTDFGNRIMALSAGCAVEDSNPPLPANCTVLSDTQQCQCSCNPGFTESTGLNSFFECVETPTNTTTTMQISTTPTQSVMGSVASTEDPPATQNSTTPTPTLGPSYQVANSSTVTIEAMCSSNSAGLKWTVPDESAYTISVGFRCASYLGYYNQDEFSDDRCFKKDGTVFIIPQLMEPFKTHIIGTELEPGTVCIFNAISRDFGDKIMDTLSASCVVGDSATSLPIQCNDTQGCQCSCSPGFIKRAHADELLECEAIATSPMENATTPPTETDTTLSSETATTPPMETDTTLSSETDTTQPMETDTTLSSETDTTQPMETDTTQPMETDTTQPMETDTTPPMETDATPPMETATMPPMETDTTPPMETDATSPMETDTTQPDIMLLIVSMVSVAVLLVSTVCGLLAICTGTAVYRNYRLKQQHKRMAMPFSSMKLEKIDPNFNPVKIDGTTLFKSGSMLSVFHNLNSFSEERKMRAEENYYFDVSTLSEAVLTTKLENHATKSDSWSIGQGVTDPAAGYENLTNSDSDDVTDLAKSTRKKVVTDSLISYQTQTQETYESASESSPADYVLPTTEVCLDFPKDEFFSNLNVYVIDTYSVNSMLCMCGVVSKNVNVCYHCYLLMFVPFVGLALYVLTYSRNILEDQGLFK